MVQHSHDWQYWEPGLYYTRLIVRYCRDCDTIQQKRRNGPWNTLPVKFSEMAIQVER